MENIQLSNNYEIRYFDDIYNNKLVGLYINNTCQSISFTDERKFELYDKYSLYYDLPNLIDKNINNTLVLGGGTLSYPKYYIYKYPNIKMDVIEINKELIDASYKYFYINELYEKYDYTHERLSIINDDAINYINNTNKKYDYIFFDAYIGYEPVSNIYEINTISKLKTILNENGYLAINYVITDNNKYNQLYSNLNNSFKYIKQYNIKEAPNFIYILASDKEIKSEDVILQ